MPPTIRAIPLLFLAALAGCDAGPTQRGIADGEPSREDAMSSRARRESLVNQRDARLRAGNDRPRWRSSRLGTGRPPAITGQLETAGTEYAGRSILELVRDTVEYRPTLVVWLVDCSPSAQRLVQGIRQVVIGSADELYSVGVSDETQDGEPPRLLSAVCAFGAEPRFLLDPPSGELRDLTRAWESVSLDESGELRTFEAVQASIVRYLPYRTSKRREVLVILITDEAGDDAERVDEVLRLPRRYAIPVYVVGVPAPFGRRQALATRVEATGRTGDASNGSVIAQGPESRELERIQLGFRGGSTDLESIDSGFGPFALERVCRASGGYYLALRRSAGEMRFTMSSEWPSPGGPRFDPMVIERYAPDYVSSDAYRRIVESNTARQALRAAARLTGFELAELPQREFTMTTEAELAQQLSRAQQVAARLEPEVNRLYEVLEQGEADRGMLTGLRWQAGYDLALGRAAATKARIEGYNAMLAALKRGRPFENASSTRWVLEPADTIEASSALQRLAERAREYLDRVISEHPGTPWAHIAQRERQDPIGWQWTER